MLSFYMNQLLKHCFSSFVVLVRILSLQERRKRLHSQVESKTQNNFEVNLEVKNADSFSYSSPASVVSRATLSP